MNAGETDATDADHEGMRWTVLEDADAVAQRVCDLVSAAAFQAIAERGVFSIVLAGGDTPRRSYALLRATAQDWSRWQVFFGDERCLPADHPDRNSAMARAALLDHVAVPPANLHVIPAEHGATAAARAYSRTIAATRPFDMVLLGLGEDGHTASLFPGHTHAGGEAVHAVFDAPKPPPERVSLAAATLADSRSILFIVCGEAKRDAVGAWHGGDTTLPVAAVQAAGRAEVLLDRPAAGDIITPGESPP